MWELVAGIVAVLGSLAILFAIIFVAADFGGSDESRERGKSK